MTTKAGKLIKTHIGFLAERWLTSNEEQPVADDEFERFGESEVKKIIYQILEALAEILQDNSKSYLFEPTGVIYRKAKFLGELRRAQGFELEQVLHEYLVLRHEIWQMLKDKLRGEDIDVFELEGYINRCLMNILKATTESFHHRQTKDLRQQAITDPLTGLYNRRQFDRIIEQEIYRATRYDRRLGLALIDIDHFKLFNDLYGHPAGDLALEEVSTIIRQFLRVSDAAARYGGEEFALILPETNQDQANRVCSRVRRSVERHNFETEEKPVQLTVSIGIACYPDDANIVKDLIDCADKALYQAKRSGRNKVICFAKNQSIKTRWFRLKSGIKNQESGARKKAPQKD